MTTSNILLTNLGKNGILRLTLNDVARRNALSEAMLAALGAAFADAGADPQVRIVVLAANGPAFCAGHDLKEMTAGRRHEDGGRAYFANVMAMCA
ncbi:MAG: enoyl-CoA hydratase-related protein, partial [Pacificibacter sp.]